MGPSASWCISRWRITWDSKEIWKKKGITTYPGEVVSVDKLVSPTPGFLPLHRGIPRNERYLGATIFDDHFSDFTYVHLTTKMDWLAITTAKEPIDCILSTHGVRVKYYHAKNGLFDTEVFKSAIRLAKFYLCHFVALKPTTKMVRLRVE